MKLHHLVGRSLLKNRRNYKSKSKYETGYSADNKIYRNMVKGIYEDGDGYPEIEFVCVNDEHCDATSPVAQRALWEDLKRVKGIVAYMQDWSHEDPVGNAKSLAVVIKDKNVTEQVKQIASKHGVEIDLDSIEHRNERYLDELVNGGVPHVIDTIINEGNETMPKYLYHATFTKNVPKIKQTGLLQFQTSNWIKGPAGSRYNEDAGIFAFDNPEDALNWAGKMEWEFRDKDKDISIVRIDMDDEIWGDDPAEDPFVARKGRALRSGANIKADKIIDAISMDDLGKPGDLGISRDVWLAQSSTKLSEDIQTITEADIEPKGLQYIDNWVNEQQRQAERDVPGINHDTFFKRLRKDIINDDGGDGRPPDGYRSKNSKISWNKSGSRHGYERSVLSLYKSPGQPAPEGAPDWVKNAEGAVHTINEYNLDMLQYDVAQLFFKKNSGDFYRMVKQLRSRKQKIDPVAKRIIVPIIKSYQEGKYDLPDLMKAVKAFANMKTSARWKFDDQERTRLEKEAPIIMKFPDGMMWVRLDSQEEFEREAGMLQNCLHGYCPVGGDPDYNPDMTWDEEMAQQQEVGGDFSTEGNLVYSLRDKHGESHAAIEYDITKPTEISLKGKQNDDPDDKYMPYVDALKKHWEENPDTFGPKVTEGDMKADREAGIEYVDDPDWKRLHDMGDDIIQAYIDHKEPKKELNEGVNDPHLFKAVFMAGCPGSGKSYIAKALFGGSGLKVVNSDQVLEYLMAKHGLDPTMPDEEKEERDIQRDRAKELTSMRQENYVGGRLGLIIDGTGKDDGKIQKAKKALEDIGYETRMVFVDTDLETAHERNMERPERSVKPELLTDTFKTCRKVGGKLRRIFDFSKEDFQVINNSKNSESEDKIKETYGSMQHWLATPVTNREALDWIDQQTNFSEGLATITEADACGNCFEKAGRDVMLDNIERTLVHALVYGQGKLKGRRFPHAWTEMGDVVFDNSNGNNIVMRKEQYYALAGVEPNNDRAYRRYTGREARHEFTGEKSLIRFDANGEAEDSLHNWGPWQLDDSLNEKKKEYKSSIAMALDEEGRDYKKDPIDIDSIFWQSPIPTTNTRPGQVYKPDSAELSDIAIETIRSFIKRGPLIWDDDSIAGVFKIPVELVTAERERMQQERVTAPKLKERIFDVLDEKFDSLAQQRAAYASGYKGKGKKNKKIQEATSSIEQQMQNAFANALAPNKKSDVFTGDEIKVATYIGPNATDWNPTSNILAKKLHQQGASEDEIWKQTRNVVGADGQWRQEISDHDTKLVGEVPKHSWYKKRSTTLGKILNAPELFKNYPGARDIEVSLDKGSDTAAWYYDNKIGLRYVPDTGSHRGRKLLHHEIQHWIDEQEGFAKSASQLAQQRISKETGIPGSDVYYGSQGEISARDVEDRLRMDNKSRGKFTPRVKGQSLDGSGTGTPQSVVIPADSEAGADYKIKTNPNYDKKYYWN